MKARFVYERLDFERGQDPKVSMGIGRIVGIKEIKVHYRTDNSYRDQGAYVLKDFSNNKFNKYWRDFRFITEDDEWLEAKDVVGYRIRFEDNIYDLIDTELPIKESLDFERGKDPKRALQIGLVELPDLPKGGDKFRVYLGKGKGYAIATAITDADNLGDGYRHKTFGLFAQVPGVENIFRERGKKSSIVQWFKKLGHRDWILSGQPDNYKDLNWDHNGEKTIPLEKTDYNYDPPPFVAESLNFERGQDPKTSMGIGKAANPIKIHSMEEEEWEGGRVSSLEDVEKANDNTWSSPIDDPFEVHFILDNWEEEIDPFYQFWARYGEDMEAEYLHPQELEGEFVDYQGQVYQIPETNLFKKISDTVPLPS